MKKIRIYVNYITYLICLLIPKKKNRWVFGAWFGNRISDNPYAIYEFVRHNHPEIESIWVCNDTAKLNNENNDIVSVKKGTLRAWWYCITASVSVMNQGYLDFGKYNWVYGSYKVQLWHGVPWKKIGEDTSPEVMTFFQKCNHRAYLFATKCDLYVAPSENCRKSFSSAFKTSLDSIFLCGQPRNAKLFDVDYCKRCKKKIQKEFCIENKNVVLYMPTFRDNNGKQYSFEEMDTNLMDRLIENNCVILEKQHYVTSRKKNNSQNARHTYNVENIDTQELLAAADILVTDYSSCFFDYLVRDLPIIYFAYDFNEYRNKIRGLYYDVEEVCAGSFVVNETALVESIINNLHNPNADHTRREEIRKKYITYESSDSVNQVVQYILSIS